MAETKKNIYEKLSDIQKAIAVPKGKHNDSSNYNYRTVDKILVIATPICEQNRTTLYTTDELVQIGERYYIQSTAHLYDWESKEALECKGWAREQFAKKGMDEAQITGSTSTYARKRALESLFSLNTEKDPDARPPREKLEENYARYRTRLTELDIDFREVENEFILNAANIKTQDNTKLNDEEMERLLHVYVALGLKKQDSEKFIQEQEETLQQPVQQPTQQSNNIDIAELTTTYKSLLMKAEEDGIDTHSHEFINHMKENAQIDSTDIGNLIVDPFALQRAIETLQTMLTPGGNK